LKSDIYFLCLNGSPNPVSSEYLSSYQSVAIPKLLETLTQQENRGIVFLSSVGPMFAFRSPESMAKIFERCRVAFVERPFNIPFARVSSDVRVDPVLLVWQLVAPRIVGDLIIDAEQMFRNRLRS
jgi:hypothetical protein